MSAASHLNALERDSLTTALTRCCASRAWVQQMAQGVPFADDDDLMQKAAEAWNRLDPADWREAFAAHPKIGDVDSLRAKFADTRAAAEREQAGTIGAAADVLEELAVYNRRYEEKFGYIFIICATGKSAAEMLASLHRRFDNDAEKELRSAAAEQLKITLLRLERIAQ